MWKLALAIVFIFPAASQADEYVSGYERRNGTYVETYYRTSPNSTTLDNYSTKPNINPYTGIEGTKNPFEIGSSGISQFGSTGGYSRSYRGFGDQ